MRRVAMISEHASPLAAVGGEDAGGQNVHVAALARAVARLGPAVVVYTRRDDPGLPASVSLAPGVVVRHVDAGPPERLPRDALDVHMDAFAHQLRRDWELTAPDVAHSHFWMSGRAAVTAAAGLDVPVAHTFHALGVVKRRFQGDQDTSPPQRLAVEAALAHDTDRVIATCREEREELAGMGANPDGVSVVPCGVDLDEFAPTGPAESRVPPEHGGQPHRIVTLGRLVPRKGADDLIAALGDIPDTELVVAGGAGAGDAHTDPGIERLRAAAERAGVADRVDFRGQVRREAVPALLRSADLVVCAPWYEPFGIVPLEAMACGTPVVTSAVGGMRDTVVHGVTGVHVPPRDRGALARMVRSLLARPDARAAMGVEAARRARRYGWPRVARETLAVYEDIVAAHARKEVMAG